LVAEVSFVDYRIAALFVLAVLCGANWMVRRGRAQGETIGAELRARRFLIVFSAVAYVAWLVSFGIYRYLVPLEILSGLLIVSGVVFLAGNGAMSRFAVLAATVAIVASTRPMNWGRKPFDGAFFQVSVPDLSQALVLIASSNPVSSDPVSYLIPFFPEETRFISPSNNFLRLGQRNLLARRVSDIVASHEGPIYSLETKALDDKAAGVCAAFGLRRDPLSCKPVASNLDPDTYVVCQLLRSVPADP
jgi:hypothetical protein